jgi:hypothetical protein
MRCFSDGQRLERLTGKGWSLRVRRMGQRLEPSRTADRQRLEPSLTAGGGKGWSLRLQRTGKGWSLRLRALAKAGVFE